MGGAASDPRRHRDFLAGIGDVLDRARPPRRSFEDQNRNTATRHAAASRLRPTVQVAVKSARASLAVEPKPATEAPNRRSAARQVRVRMRIMKLSKASSATWSH